jgi:hypothetical protein
MQMVREFEMDRKTRALAGQTSSIPAWISDRKAVPAGPGINSATKVRKTFAKPLAGIKAGSAGKAHALGRLFCKALFMILSVPDLDLRISLSLAVGPVVKFEYPTNSTGVICGPPSLSALPLLPISLMPVPFD